MQIKTKHFGEIEIDEKSIIHFEEGIPGFDDVKKFVILNDENNAPFRWLQSVEKSHAAFVIINPFEIKKDYEVEIDDNTQKALGIEDVQDVAVYSIVVVPENVSEMTANFKAPIVVNISNNKGKQMIMDKSPYHTKHYILEELLKVQSAQGQEGK